MVLAFAVVLLSFSLPKLYEAKKSEIDQAVSKGVNQSRAFYEQNVAPQVTSPSHPLSCWSATPASRTGVGVPERSCRVRTVP